MNIIDQYIQESTTNNIKLPPPEMISEALMFSTDDLQLRVDEWEQGKIKTLFITGYLGSGKTHTGKELAKEYNAKFIELDCYKRKEMDKLVKETGLPKITDEQAKKLWEKVFKNIESRIKLNKERLVIEGIDILRLNRELVLSQAILIKGTSLFKSTYRANKRNIQNKCDRGYKDKSALYIIKDTIGVQKRMYKRIDNFIKDVKLTIIKE
jgi:gluconate kinase